MASRLIVVRSTAVKARWLSTADATATEKSKNLYQNILMLKIRPYSDVNIKEIIDEWANQLNPIKRFDIVSQINYFSSRKCYHFSLQ